MSRLHSPMALLCECQVLHKSNPTQAEVDAAHEAFCRAITDLFDRYKMYYGWGHKTLNIV